MEITCVFKQSENAISIPIILMLAKTIVFILYNAWIKENENDYHREKSYREIEDVQ